MNRKKLPVEAPAGDAFLQMVRDAAREIEDESAPVIAGRPQADRYTGRQVALYLREDVEAYLRAKAASLGNGESPSRIVNKLVRAAMKADPVEARDGDAE